MTTTSFVDSWKPRARGTVYCAPACGRGCTRAEFNDANRQAKMTLRDMKTKGWVIRVWENLGWHWELTNERCAMSLHNSGGMFWCMLADGNGTRCSNGSMRFSDSFKRYKDPNDAVRLSLRKALVVMRKAVKTEQQALANLESIRED